MHITIQPITYIYITLLDIIMKTTPTFQDISKTLSKNLDHYSGKFKSDPSPTFRYVCLEIMI